MLKQLGITHVVSMGESALTPPRQAPFSLSSPFSRTPALPTNSLWLEERLGSIAVLDIDNIADDGIAGIRRTFDQCLDFIEHARNAGGKVLVHCRVGVSRSATIVIAYLMRELELDLKSAYLLARSRRLNILIQVRFHCAHGLIPTLTRPRSRTYPSRRRSTRTKRSSSPSATRGGSSKARTRATTTQPRNSRSPASSGPTGSSGPSSRTRSRSSTSASSPVRFLPSRWHRTAR